MRLKRRVLQGVSELGGWLSRRLRVRKLGPPVAGSKRLCKLTPVLRWGFGGGKLRALSGRWREGVLIVAAVVAREYAIMHVVSRAWIACLSHPDTA